MRRHDEVTAEHSLPFELVSVARLTLLDPRIPSGEGRKHYQRVLFILLKEPDQFLRRRQLIGHLRRPEVLGLRQVARRTVVFERPGNLLIVRRMTARDIEPEALLDNSTSQVPRE